MILRHQFQDIPYRVIRFVYSWFIVLHNGVISRLYCYVCLITLLEKNYCRQIAASKSETRYIYSTSNKHNTQYGASFTKIVYCFLFFLYCKIFLHTYIVLRARNAAFRMNKSFVLGRESRKREDILYYTRAYGVFYSSRKKKFNLL